MKLAADWSDFVKLAFAFTVLNPFAWAFFLFAARFARRWYRRAEGNRGKVALVALLINLPLPLFFLTVAINPQAAEAVAGIAGMIVFVGAFGGMLGFLFGVAIEYLWPRLNRAIAAGERHISSEVQH